MGIICGICRGIYFPPIMENQMKRTWRMPWKLVRSKCIPEQRGMGCRWGVCRKEDLRGVGKRALSVGPGSAHGAHVWGFLRIPSNTGPM